MGRAGIGVRGVTGPVGQNLFVNGTSKLEKVHLHGTLISFHV